MSKIKSTTAMLLFFSLSGCAQYQSRPLTENTIEQQLQTPNTRELTVRATEIKHSLLKPVAFNLQDGLSPDEAAVVAVLQNPHLRAVRDQYNLAKAQLLVAGLLPDPQLSYTFTVPSGGTDSGMINAFGVGLNWQVTALIWRSNKIKAAELQQEKINLQIAWQEWQIAQDARLAAYQLIIYSRQEALLREMTQRLEENRSRLQQAADKGLVTELERVAAVSAKNLADNRLLALTQQKRQQQKRLNRAMGLQPFEVIPLQADINLDEPLNPPEYEDLIHDLENRRLDLLALQLGYASQDERVHIAVLQQFPKISIGFNQARDNSNLYTLGFGVSITAPIFNRNQGQIAIQRATRQQLFDQYINRLFQARSDIAELQITITSLNQRLASVQQATPELNKLVNAYRSALVTGQVDVLNYYVVWNKLTNKKVQLLTLTLQLIKACIALEVASGMYQLS